jgi:hypothetical protein
MLLFVSLTGADFSLRRTGVDVSLRRTAALTLTLTVAQWWPMRS